MKLFSFNPDEIVTSYFVEKSERNIAEAISDASISTFGFAKDTAAISMVKDSGAKLSVKDLENQFVVFQIGDKLGQPAILESSQVIPKIEGSDDQPDVLVGMEMLSFHLAQNEEIDKNTRATIRINIGKDTNSRDKYFDTAFWSIASGLNLYNQAKGKVAEPKDLKSDFKKAFGNRPIEIPGGLSQMTFEVVKHREPKWWQKVFSFLESDTGKSLVSTVGFPAITNQAIGMLDELLNRLTDSEPEVLFQSLPLRLAMSQLAKNDFTAGNERIKIGSLNPGFCILARGKDFTTILDSDAIYYPSYGKLVPSKITESQLMTGRYDDPFRDVTYSILRIGMKGTKLDPTFNYGK